MSDKNANKKRRVLMTKAAVLECLEEVTDRLAYNDTVRINAVIQTLKVRWRKPRKHNAALKETAHD